jgi:fatty-acyl-CoA synthase
MDINWIVDSPFDPSPVGDPSATAVSIDGIDSLTYAQLRERRNQYVHLLRGSGVQPGDRVGMVLLNSLDYFALYFAITRIGAIAVRVNFRLAPEELAYVLRDAGCSVVVFHTSRVAQIEPIHQTVEVRAWFAIPDGTDSVPPWAVEPDVSAEPAHDVDLPRPAGTDPLMLMYTSGTTGRPKGVCWTHDNALWLASIQAVKWSYTPETVAMTTGPLYHAGAFEDLLLPALFVHGTAVSMSTGGMTTERIVATMRRASVTHALLYPFLLYGLLRDERLTSEDVGSLKAILAGGDPILPWALTAIDEKLPEVELQQGYGLTEGGTMSTCLDHRDRIAHPDSVGRPMPLTQVRTVLPDGAPAAPDEVGEVWVRSPTVTAGYWNKPAETAETFVDGWCRTGDLGRITPDGFLVLTGRAKDMIRSGGENIYPAEVEAVLAQHADVSAVAVIAVPDQRFLEVGCAVVVRAHAGFDRDDDVIERELRAVAKERLAGYKCPRHYVFVSELPVTASGKVQKHVLRSRFASLGSRPEQVMS